MTEPHRDPLDVLALPVDRPEPGTAPDPAFATALRARLEGVLLGVRPTEPDTSRPHLRGAAMTTTTSTADTAAALGEAAAVPTGSALTPYLVVADARAALAWYASVLGAVPHGEPDVSDDGRVGHAEVVVGGALLMLADEHPELGLVGPLALGGVSTTLHLQVADVDAVVARAVAAGAVLEREPADAPYGRTGVVRDPAGHRWMLQAATVPAGPVPAAPVPAASAPAGAGPAAAQVADVAYVTVAVPDARTAREFYGEVLGWRFTPGSVAEGWEVEGAQPSVGLWGGATQEPPQVQLCYRVPDLASALRAVRARGGSAQEPQDKPYGRLVECTDPAGLRFQLWQPPGQ